MATICREAHVIYSSPADDVHRSARVEVHRCETLAQRLEGGFIGGGGHVDKITLAMALV